MTQPHPPAPPRGPQCPPPVVLEALSAGERPDDEVARHVSGCDACRGYVEELSHARDAFLKARPPERFLKQLGRKEAEKPRKAWWRWLLAGIPVAAAAVLAIAIHPGDEIRTKGRHGLQVAVRPAGATDAQLAATDTRVKAGDSLRFGWNGEQDGNLLVLERDGTGSTSVFWPFGATASAPVKAAGPDFLEGSVELDAAPGPEWIVAVFSPRPLDAGPLLEELRASDPAAPKVSCDDCTVQTLRLLKEP